MHKTIFIGIILLFGAVLLLSADDNKIIEHWCLGEANTRAPQDDYIQVFHQKYPDITLNVTRFPYAQIYEKLLAAFAAGNEPDTCEAMLQAVAIPIRQGKIAPLPAEYFPKAEIENRFSAEALKNVQFRGNYYGVLAGGGSVSGTIIYNKKIFKDAGISVAQIKTWSDLLRIAQKLTKRDANGQMTQAGWSWHACEEAAHYQSLVATAGGQMIDSNGNPAFKSRIGKKVLQDYVDFFKKYKVDDMTFPGARGIEQNFAKGHVAMLMEGVWFVKWMNDSFPFVDVGAFTAPSPYPPRKWTPVMFSVEGWFATTKGAKPSTWKFLQYLASEDQLLNWNLKTGDITGAKTLWNNPELTGNPLFGPFLGALPDTKYVGWVRSGNRWIGIIGQMLQKAATGQMSVDDAISWADTEERKLFAEYDETVPKM